MTLTQFIKNTIGVILASIGLSKITKAEGKPMFNVQKLQERILELKANPPIALIPDEIKENLGSGAYLHFKKMPEYGLLMNEICDREYQYFYISERVVSPDGSGWMRVRPYQCFTYLHGNVFPLTRVWHPEGTI